jgi:hypothetical protein
VFGEDFRTNIALIRWKLEAEDFTASIASDLERTGIHGKRRTIPYSFVRSVPCHPGGHGMLRTIYTTILRSVPCLAGSQNRA